jgi:tRNA-dihydrouridine synthase
LAELRSIVSDRPLTVKIRIGFDNADTFYEILDMLNRHNIDLLSLHGRTVKDMYHGEGVGTGSRSFPIRVGIENTLT